MGEPLYPPDATPEQRRRIDRALIRMLEPRKLPPATPVGARAAGDERTQQRASSRGVGNHRK